MSEKLVGIVSSALLLSLPLSFSLPLALLLRLLLLPPPRRNSALRSLPMVVEVEADTAAAAAEAVPPRRVREERPSSIVRACVRGGKSICVRACVRVWGGDY